MRRSKPRLLQEDGQDVTPSISMLLDKAEMQGMRDVARMSPGGRGSNSPEVLFRNARDEIGNVIDGLRSISSRIEDLDSVEELKERIVSLAAEVYHLGMAHRLLRR